MAAETGLKQPVLRTLSALAIGAALGEGAVSLTLVLDASEVSRAVPLWLYALLFTLLYLAGVLFAPMYVAVYAYSRMSPRPHVSAWTHGARVIAATSGAAVSLVLMEAAHPFLVPSQSQLYVVGSYILFFIPSAAGSFWLLERLRPYERGGPIWWWRRHRRRKAGLCFECGYDLTGNVSGICPECGTEIEQT